MISVPILAFPDMNSEEPLIVTVDSGSEGIGYVLSQRRTQMVNWWKDQYDMVLPIYEARKGRCDLQIWNGPECVLPWRNWIAGCEV